MSDPITRLDQFRADTPGTHGAPMKPAADVRRRGDQIRRRRNVATGAIAAVLAATVGSAAFALGGGLSDRGIDPAPAPSESTSVPSPTETTAPDATGWPQRVPDSFPLQSGMEPESSDETLKEPSRTNDPVELDACNEELSDDTPQPVDRVTTSLSDGSSGQVREIRLFADNTAAAEFTTALQTLTEGCTSFDSNGGPTDSGSATPPFYTQRVVTPGLGDQGFDVLTDSDGVGRSVLHVVRVGNAVFLDAAGDEGAGTSGGAEDLAVEVRENAADVHAAMYDLMGSEGAADPESNPPSSSAPAAILGDAQLVSAASLPALPMEGESSANWQQVPAQPTPTLYCQGAWLSSLKAAESVSREFRLENPGEIGKVNVTVLEFATKPAADAAYETVHGWLGDCPASMSDAKLFIARPVESIAVGTSPEVDRAAQMLAEYAGDCGGQDCDATWYDHQTVAQIGTRLVLVTHAEASGPCPPTRACPPEEASDYTEWDNRVAQTVEATVGQAIVDLR